MHPGLGRMLTIYQVIAGSHQAVVEPSQQTPEALVQPPPVINAGAILIPGPVSTLIYLTCVHTLTQPTEQPMPGLQQARLACTTQLNKRTKTPCMSYVYCTTKKIKCISATLGSPPKCSQAPSTTW